MPSEGFKVAANRRLPFQAQKSQVSIPPATFVSTANKQLRGAARALAQMEASYEKMIAGIKLEAFDPKKIEDYIRQSEKNSGVVLSEAEKERIRQAAKSRNDKMLRLLALELGVGVPLKHKKQVLYYLGELMINRQDKQALAAFINDPTKDENLKAHVKTVLLAGQVEEVLYKVESFKGQFNSVFKHLSLGKSKN